MDVLAAELVRGMVEARVVEAASIAVRRLSERKAPIVRVEGLDEGMASLCDS